MKDKIMERLKIYIKYYYNYIMYNIESMSIIEKIEFSIGVIFWLFVFIMMVVEFIK